LVVDCTGGTPGAFTSINAASPLQAKYMARANRK
jgi:hypothetical protein